MAKARCGMVMSYSQIFQCKGKYEMCFGCPWLDSFEDLRERLRENENT